MLTPLNWSLWKRGGEARAARGADRGRRAGAPPRRRARRATGPGHGPLPRPPRRQRRLHGPDGRPAARRRAARRSPSSCSAACPTTSSPSRPSSACRPIAVSMPRALTQSPRAVRAPAPATTGPWWSAEVARVRDLDLDGRPRRSSRSRRDRFAHAMSLHVTCVFATVQPLYDVVLRLSRRGPRRTSPSACIAGLGNHAEVAVVERPLGGLAATGSTSTTFLARHGYHGHDEGEIASHVWREDPQPVQRARRAVPREREREPGRPSSRAVPRNARRPSASCSPRCPACSARSARFALGPPAGWSRCAASARSRSCSASTWPRGCAAARGALLARGRRHRRPRRRLLPHWPGGAA